MCEHLTEDSPSLEGNRLPPGEVARPPSRGTLRAVIDSSRDAICFIELASDRITHVNRAAESLFGYTGDAWMTLRLADLIPGIDERILHRETAFSTCHAQHRDGRLISVQWALVASPEDSTAIGVFRALAAVESLSDSDRDPLTGLPNRSVFEARLKESIQRSVADFAVLFLDLDGFKQINDRFGHMVGDAVLRMVAERLIHSLRPTDTIARYGGDEFIVLLEDMQGETSAANAAQRLLAAIAEPLAVEGHILRVGASAGIVLRCECPDLAQTIRAADRAMYRAKALGPGQYVVFSEQDCPPFPVVFCEDLRDRRDSGK